MANSIADLISGSEAGPFHQACVVGFLHRAQAGAAVSANATANRTRWDTLLQQNPTLLDRIATQQTSVVASDATVSADWGTNGQIVQADVDNACENALVAVAASSQIDYGAITTAMTDQNTADLLVGAAAAAAVAILKGTCTPAATPAMVAFAKQKASKLPDIQQIVTNAMPLIVAHPALAPYMGQLAGVDSATLTNALTDLVAAWTAGT